MEPGMLTGGGEKLELKRSIGSHDVPCENPSAGTPMELFLRLSQVFGTEMAARQCSAARDHGFMCAVPRSVEGNTMDLVLLKYWVAWLSAPHGTTWHDMAHSCEDTQTSVFSVGFVCDGVEQDESADDPRSRGQPKLCLVELTGGL